jgi:O-antigen ligase
MILPLSGALSSRCRGKFTIFIGLAKPRTRWQTMLDRLFFISLVLNATGLFRFIAPQIGVTIGYVSLALLAFNCVYLIAKADYTVPILLRGGMGRWLLVLLVWPLLTLLYAPAFDLREVGLQLYFFTLFLGTVVYCAGNGLPAMYRMLTISLVVTIVGMPLSMMAPQYFEAVAALAEAQSEVMGRPIGFYMQPNSLAISLCLIFIAWFALRKIKSVSSEVVVILIFLGLQLLTGSRMGVLVGVGIAGIVLMYNWPKRLIRGRLIYTGGLLLICLGASVAGLRTYLAVVSDTGYRQQGDLLDRMESIVTFRINPTGDLVEDTSLSARFDTQANYLELVLDRPWLGYGFGSDVYYQDTGQIWISAHSQALTYAFEYGVLNPLVVCLVVLSLYWKRGRRSVEHALDSNSVGQFVAAFLVLFAYASVTEARVFYIVLGLVFAMVQYSKHLFEYDEETGRLGAMLSREAIRLRRRQFASSEKQVSPARRPGPDNQAQEFASS